MTEQDQLSQDVAPGEAQSRPDDFMQRVEAIGGELASKLERYKASRTVKEQEWLNAVQAYNGHYTETEKKRIAERDGSMLFLNITRAKTDAFAANISDILLPTEEKNWGIEHTPKPSIKSAAKTSNVIGKTPQGNPITVADVAEGIKQVAKEACEKMELLMEDQLAECNYNAEMRDGIDYMCQLGTIVLCGPTKAPVRRMRWEQVDGGVFELVPDKAAGKPEYRAVDPRHFYPDPNATKFSECEDVFETMFLTARSLRALAKSQGFNEQAIKDAIDEGKAALPQWYQALRSESGQNNQVVTGVYEAWMWHGDIDPQNLAALGADTDTFDLDKPRIPACIWGVGNTVIYASVNPMDTGDMPYSVRALIPDTTSIFGHGVPWAAKNAQESLNSAWRVLHDNAQMSSSPQLAINRLFISGADGNNTLKSRKVWNIEHPTDAEAVVDVRAAMQFFTVPNNSAELLNILKTALELLDQELNFSLMMGGVTNENSPDTAKGTQILYNAGRVVVRRVVKGIDDDITVPNIQRLYDWNMQFTDDPTIKGDFNIIAKGSSVLMERQEQLQAMTQSAQIVLNPQFDHVFDADVFLETYAKNLRLPPNVIRAKDERDKRLAEKQKQQPQPSPDKMAELQVKDKIATEDRQSRDQSTARTLEVKAAELRMRGEQHNDLISMAANELNMTRDEVMQRLGIDKMKLDSENARFNTESAIKTRMGSGI